MAEHTVSLPSGSRGFQGTAQIPDHASSHIIHGRVQNTHESLGMADRRQNGILDVWNPGPNDGFSTTSGRVRFCTIERHTATGVSVLLHRHRCQLLHTGHVHGDIDGCYFTSIKRALLEGFF